MINRHPPTSESDSTREPPERSAAEGVPASTYAVCWLDLRGRVSRWSDAAAVLFGREAPGVVGQSFHELFTAEDREAGRPDIALARARESGSWDDVGWRPTAGGPRRWTAYSVTLVRTPNDVDIGYMVVTRDLGDLAARGHDGPSTASGARLLTAGRVVTEVAHEVGNVLAAARGFTTALERHLPQDGVAHQVWRELLKACDKGSSITSRLLRVGRASDDTGRRVELEPLVRSLEPLLRQVLPGRVLLMASVQEGLPPIQGKQSDIELILLNLVVNARDAIDGNGTIAISVGSVRTGPEGPRVVLTVRDSGCGIPDEMVERVFDRFFTTKDPGQGTGLGLTLVRDAVLACRGEIEIESGASGGTTIRVAFRTRRRVSEAASDPVYTGVRETVVLVCAARETLRQCLTDLLERNGFGVLAATTPAEARELYRAHSTAVDLALVSTPSPEDGTELVDYLHSDGAGLPALLLGDPSSEPSEELSLRPERLLDQIEQVLADGGLDREGAVH